MLNMVLSWCVRCDPIWMFPHPCRLIARGHRGGCDGQHKAGDGAGEFDRRCDPHSYAWLGGRAYVVDPANGVVMADVTE
jgi:hypothetical protein